VLIYLLILLLKEIILRTQKVPTRISGNEVLMVEIPMDHILLHIEVGLAAQHLLQKFISILLPASQSNYTLSYPSASISFSFYSRINFVSSSFAYFHLQYLPFSYFLIISAFFGMLFFNRL
jgi:hypothetical protein